MNEGGPSLPRSSPSSQDHLSFCLTKVGGVAISTFFEKKEEWERPSPHPFQKEYNTKKGGGHALIHLGRIRRMDMAICPFA